MLKFENLKILDIMNYKSNTNFCDQFNLSVDDITSSPDYVISLLHDTYKTNYNKIIKLLNFILTFMILPNDKCYGLYNIAYNSLKDALTPQKIIT